jgi:hypothetical protein
MRTRAYRLQSRERCRRDTQASTLCRSVLTRCGADSHGDSNGISRSQSQTHDSMLATLGSHHLNGPGCYAISGRSRVAPGSRQAAVVVGKGRESLTAFSRTDLGLTGRYGILASIPDTQQDADLRFWIAKHYSLLLGEHARHYFDRRVCGVSSNIGGFTEDAVLPAFVW